ncbi:MAG: Ig-like domain-containing protein [Mycobacterium kyogaense]|uniref:Ig-like domain-containing protein n=1 Tax=Mycobacterium kyogaense TaxID=2212479 RepID=UPI002FFAB994
MRGDLPVRRWLALAAASAGAAAGLAVLGPQIGVAAADSTGGTSASSSESRADTGPAARRARLTEARNTRAANRDSRRADRRAGAEAETSDDSAPEPATPKRQRNKAPTVAPEQLSGVIEGPITGTVGAVDPDGDPIRYRVIRSPKSGSVALDDDGTYTYTPGSSFNGVDTFRVIAIDEAARPKVFRPVGTRATALINQDAVTFEFDYANGAEYWTPERREALQDAANDLLVYLRVKKPVTLTYKVNGEDDPDSTTLAAAGSNLVSQRPGFWPSVVQKKLLTGIDANGKAADGEIDWNFDHDWGLGDTVTSDEYDFAATAMHELLHSFGFRTGISAPGENTDRDWAMGSRFVRTADGKSPISREHRWITRYDPNLTGGDGGLYFGGRYAVAAYGGLVPLYTPNPWDQGSSMGHLDDSTFTGANEKMMNARTDKGPGVRVLSPVEIGILRDLGYDVRTPAPALAFAGLLVPILRRRNKRSAAEHTP